MKKKLLIAVLYLSAGISTAFAQHELSINAFTGMQALSLSITDNGTSSGNFGLGGGIGYNYNFNQTWSIGIGADLSCYSSTIKFNNFNYSYTGIDELVKSNYVFNAEASAFKEDASALFLEIPVTARYSLPVGSNSLRFTGGVRLGLPLNAKYTASAGQLSTSGSYTYEQQLYENIEGVFLKNAVMPEQSGNWDAKLSIMLTLEAAYRIAIAEKYGLSLGIYFNYGLNDIQGKDNAHPVAFQLYEHPYTTNSILDSKYASGIRPFAIGLKLRFDLGL
jgi:hypothetical protein